MKFVMFFLCISGCALGLTLESPSIIGLADGSTNYEGIHYTVENDKFSDGISLCLIVDTSLPKNGKDVDVILHMENSEGETVLVCGVAGREKDGKFYFRVFLANQYLMSSELWVHIDNSDQRVLRLVQFKNMNNAKENSL